MNTHLQNIEQYLASGGDQRLAKLHRTSTLQNRSRIVYLLSKLKTTDLKSESNVPAECKIYEEHAEPVVQERPKFLGEIMQYPAELHSTYSEVESLWFSYCRIKLELNKVPAEDEKRALDMQNKISELFKRFDSCKKILDHYLEFRHILPVKSERDFKNYTPLQLDQERRNLESLLCRRRQTIKKMVEQLPEESDVFYNKRIAAVNHKKEQLQIMTLEHEKIIELINA